MSDLIIKVIAVIIVLLIAALIAMATWNNVMPALFGVKAITYGQSLNLLILCRLLFAGMDSSSSSSSK